MRRIRVIALIGALSLLLAAGCGDDDGADGGTQGTTGTTTGGGTGPDGCLITLEEVNQVTGLDMVPIDGSSCGFEIPLDPNAGLNNPPNAGAQVFYRQTSSNAVEAFLQGGVAVDDLGDAAAFDDLVGGLVVASGDFYFELQLLDIPGDILAQAVALAEIVLAKL